MTDAPSPASPAGGPQKEQPEFQVIRSAPQPANSNPVPLFLVLLLVVGGGIAWYMTQNQAPADGGNGTATPTPVATAEVEVPDFVWERLDFLEDQGNVAQAYDEGVEFLEEYPNRELRTRVNRYKLDLGLVDEPQRPVPVLVDEAKQALSDGRIDEALGLAEDILEQDDENPDAYFVRGFCRGSKGQDMLGAVGDLESAIELGYEPAAEAEALIKRFQR